MHQSPLESVFFATLEKGTVQERESYLQAACAGDEELLRRVRRMVDAEARGAGFLEQPAFLVPTAADEPGGRAGDEEQAGSMVGPYKLLEPLGEGGMGTVWMAQQTEPVRRLVAVKLIKPGMGSTQTVARFEAERQALALMDHANIARVLDAGATATGRPYFVMELVPGSPITAYCDEHRLTIRERLELFVPVCLAIQHAHQQGIIHRDIKPSNVLVTDCDGRPVPKVIDFGVAKAIEQRLTERTLFTRHGLVLGTLEYMSPEQVALNSSGVDTRSDIYSLGVLLYELLTGGTPLSGARIQDAPFAELVRMITEEEPPTPSARVRAAESALAGIARDRGTDPGRLARVLRGELDWITMRALEKDRTLRYESARALATDVQRSLADEPVLASPGSSVYRLRKLVRRRRRAVFTTSALGAVAGALALAGWQSRQAGLETARRKADTAIAREIREAHERIPHIESAIGAGDHARAFALLQTVERRIPDHPRLPELLERCAEQFSIASTPPGADVWRRPYDGPDGAWEHVVRTGDTPVSVRLARGEHVWRAAKAGYREVIGLRQAPEARFSLDAEEAIPAGMVRIPGGTPARPSMTLAVAFRPVRLPAFLIDRHEVTNAEFERFVRAGGYSRKDLWEGLEFVDAAGSASTWEATMARLVDETGLPGPATWRDGAFPPGEDDFPVRGVSWYEAMAYARFAGKSLPTVYHWVQAGQIEPSVALAGNAFITRSNFRGTVLPVTALRDYGVHGTLGMAGNVSEWCFTDNGEGRRYLVGGACGDPIYLPLVLGSRHPLERGALLGFRCAQVDGQDSGDAWEPAGTIPWAPAPTGDELVDAATFDLAVRDRFAYDRGAPLDSTSEQVDEGEWVHVVARLNAAYRDPSGRWERLTVHVYLPKRGPGPGGHQAVVYCPGADGYMLPRIRPLAEEYGLDALVRSGRAVVRPVYFGMYERRPASPPDSRAAWEERRLRLAHDLMRAIDYLQERGDINMGTIGYYGFSLGAEWAGSLLAVEPRVRAAVFEAGGLPNLPLTRTHLFLNWRHYLPQIRVPVLMLNGGSDPVYPVEESQAPMFRLLGSAVKEHVVHPEGHHMLPHDFRFSHMNRWFDQHLGRVSAPEPMP